MQETYFGEQFVFRIWFSCITIEKQVILAVEALGKSIHPKRSQLYWFIFIFAAWIGFENGVFGHTIWITSLWIWWKRPICQPIATIYFVYFHMALYGKRTQHLLDKYGIDISNNLCLLHFSHSALGTFSTNHSKWNKLFPRIRGKFTTLSFHMYVPIMRELLMNWGYCAASPNSLNTLLSQSNDPNHESNRDGYTSNAPVLMVHTILIISPCFMDLMSF